MGRHKLVVCKKCLRIMRSDNLNRHMKLHEKLCEDSLDSKSIYSSRESLHKDDKSEFSSLDLGAPLEREDPLEREGIIKTLKLDDVEYNNKQKLGKMIYE